VLHISTSLELSQHLFYIVGGFRIVLKRGLKGICHCLFCGHGDWQSRQKKAQR
jgi:hypothetical protein